MIKNVIIACDYAFYQGGEANVAIETAIALAKYSDYNIYFLQVTVIRVLIFWIIK